MCIFCLLSVSNRRSDKISYYCNSDNLKTSKRFHAEDSHKLCKPYNCISSSIFRPFCFARNLGKTQESCMENIFPLGKNRYGKLLCKCGRHGNCISYNTDHRFSFGCSHCITRKWSRSYWNNASVGRWSSRSFKGVSFIIIILMFCTKNWSCKCLSQSILSSGSFDSEYLDFSCFPLLISFAILKIVLAFAASVAAFKPSFA